MAPVHKKQRLSSDSQDADHDTTTAAMQMSDIASLEPTKNGPSNTDKSQRRSLFVRSLPATSTTASLTALFSHSYPIKHATAVTDKATKTCKGYGFVTFADAEDCARAKEEFNGHVLDGRKLRVEIAEPRQREQDGPAVLGETRQKPETAGEKFKKQKELEMKERPSTKLIVRNLPWSIKTEAQLEKLFLSFGKVKRVSIPKKGGKGGLMPGFGFVVMRGRKNAEKALGAVNGKEVDGRTVAVDWAVEKEVWTGQKGEDMVEDGSDDDLANGNEEDVDVEMLDGASDFDDNDDEGADEDEFGDDLNEDMEDDEPQARSDDKTTTLFIRNIPFSCTDEDLEDHFSQFGSVRYARVVLDHATERPKGTGFVCFYNTGDADECVKSAPRLNIPKPADGKRAAMSGPSLLQDEYADPSGKYTLDGRILQVSRAVEKKEANRLTQEGVAYRNHRDRDKRRLYLLSEGTIPSNSALWESLPPSERTMREASGKQRKQLIESNPSLNLSLTRLSVRNIPRSITSKDLKQLARESVVGFATDVKAGQRARLSKEELARGGEEMVKAEKERKVRAKGIVKQAKIVFEGLQGAKVDEASGAGRSRGYGFIEYFTHRSALMGLRWLNGHSVGYSIKEKEGKGKKSKEIASEKKKRLIVEFAIENAQVVGRRREREEKAKERPVKGKDGEVDQDGEAADGDRKPGFKKRSITGNKRKRSADDVGGKEDEEKSKKESVDEKTSTRSRIIQKKRMARRAKKQGGA